MKRVVITGATGMLGIALINECIKNNTAVLAIVRENSNKLKFIPASPRVTVMECDLGRIKNLNINSDSKYDVFYHFAWDGTFGDARNDMYLQNKNIQYTLDAVQLAQSLGCHTFIGAGSQAEYGRVGVTLTPETPVFPETGYGMAKLCAGQMSRVLCHDLDMKHIWVRILSVYGPHDGEKTMVMSTIRKLLQGEVPKFTKGEQMWDYLYSADAADAMHLLGDKGCDGKIYCLGSGQARPLYEYIYTIRDAVGSKTKIELGTVSYAQNQIMYLQADIFDLTKDTGFVPHISFEEGVRKTVEWVKNLFN